MKKWSYEGHEWTLDELYSRSDCLVSKYELQVNLVKRKRNVKDSLKTKIKLGGRKPDIHFIHGVYLTTPQVSELSQCEVSYWKLCKHLRLGYSIEEAMKEKPTHNKKKFKKIKKYVKTELKSVLKEIGSPYQDAQGSQISFNHREVSKYRPELSWDYIAAKKLNTLLEARKDEIELAKQLNEEDCTQRTK